MPLPPLSYAQRFEDFHLWRCFGDQRTRLLRRCRRRTPGLRQCLVRVLSRRLARHHGRAEPGARRARPRGAAARSSAMRASRAPRRARRRSTCSANSTASRPPSRSTRAQRREGSRPQRRGADAAGDDARGAVRAARAGDDSNSSRSTSKAPRPTCCAAPTFRASGPRSIVVEAIKPLSLEPAWDEWEPLLARHGYAYVWDDELNRYYVAEEARALGRPPRRGTEVVCGRAADRQFQAGRRGPGPSGSSARPAAGGRRPDAAAADRARATLLDLLTAGVAGLDRPAGAADVAAIMARLFGALSRTAADQSAAGQRNHSRGLSHGSSIPMHSARPAAASRQAMRGEARFVLPRGAPHSLYGAE